MLAVDYVLRVRSAAELAGSITGPTGVWINKTPPWVSLATDLSGISSNVSATDAYGCTGVTMDPTRPGTGYFGPAYQGIAKTIDYWETSFQVFAPSGGFDGTAWRIECSPDGSYLLALNGYGSGLGVRRSTDGGNNWTNVLGGDVVSDLQIEPADSNHVIVTPHGPGDTAHWYESNNKGVDWTDIGAQDPGIFAHGIFLSATVFLARSPNGLFRMVKSGGTWSSTLVLASLDGPHGGAQFHRNAATGYIYVGGLDKSDNRQKIWRSLDGITWTVVSNTLGGGAYGTATIWGSPNLLLAMANFATHSTYGPLALQSTPSTGNSWSDMSTPVGITNGAHSACVMTDGVKFRHVTVNDNAGLFIYDEP